MRAQRVLLLLAALSLLVGLGPAAWSQQIPQATCLDCHEAEGMRYAVIQTTPFLEIPQGERQELEVTVANPWLHEIESSLIRVDLGNQSPVAFETPDPLNLSQEVSLSPQPGENTTRIPFKVLPGATAVTVHMTQPEDTTQLGGIDVDTRLLFPEGPPAQAPPDGVDTSPPLEQPRPANTVESFVLRGDPLASRGTGTWNVSLELASGPPDTTAQVEVQVFYNSTRTQSRLIGELIGPGESASTTFGIQGLEGGQANLAFDVVLTTYYDHPSGIGAQDRGNHTMEDGLNFTVGQELRLGDAGPAVPPTPPINWKLNARIWGEATGFIGLFLVPLSLILGGAFGRQNVLWMNKITGSARLRVLWHNALSFFLLGITILHLVLFLYEEVYVWSVGMIWGGSSTLALIGLAITGGFQRRFARSMGYATWRLLHIFMAVAFVATLLAHVLIDGAHFDIFREWFGLT